MEYTKIYEKSYNEATIAIRRTLVSKFKKFKVRNRPFKPMANGFLSWATDFSNTRFENKFKEMEQEAFLKFKNRWALYEGKKLEVIQWVLGDEVKAAYQNRAYLSYEKFIAELAKYEAFSEIISHFDSYYSYYELVYKQNKFGYFYLKDFDGYNFDSSKEYNEMMDIEYPNRAKERAAMEKNLKPWFNNEALHASGTTDLIDSFDDDQRMLMVYIFYNHIFNAKGRPEFPLTNFLKFLKIAGTFKDMSIFLEKAQSSTLYSKANKGLDYYKSNASQIKIINGTLAKLKNHDLGFITDSLRGELIKIKNSKS